MDFRYVFLGRNEPGKPMSEVSLNQAIKCIGYGGRVIGHGSRHTMFTVLHEKGYNTACLSCSLCKSIKILFAVNIITIPDMFKGNV